MAGKPTKEIDVTGVLVNADVQLADFLIIAPVLIPIMFGAVLLMMRASDKWFKKPFNQSGIIASVGMFAMMFVSYLLLLRVIELGPVAMTMGRWVPPFGISFSVDLLGAIFVLTTAVVAFLCSIYALSDSDNIDRKFGFYPFFMLMIAGVAGSFLTGDIFNLYVWFEVFLISSFGLIVLGSGKQQLDGTIKYAFLNLVATTMFLIATGLLYGLLGTLNMADIANKIKNYDGSGPIITISVLYLSAFCMKAAAFPLNIWLPASYHTPKLLVSALFAGLLTKVGIYSLLRVNFMLFSVQSDVIAIGIAILAVASMFVGVFGALAQNDIRRIMGYLLISGIGTMLAGMAIGNITGISGVIVYAVHSMLVMTALYLVVDVIGRLSKTYDLRKLGGLYAASPLLAAVFFVLCLSLSGLPITSGFWGKFILLKSTLQAGAWWLAASILVSSILTSIAIFRIWLFAFWRGGPQKTQDGQEKYKVATLSANYQFASYLTISILTVLVLIIGFNPDALISLSSDAANTILYS
ncbi:MAG: Na+/H+ antiporter subunit D, partial [Nitratireductor sp.]